jgi:Pvc16 N-terminal domain/Carboxypeptidase regulatory-like domain
MLSHIDNLLRHLFISEVASIASEDQVRFQPPDQEWRTVVSNLGALNALNVYLFEMRENRKLRTNERTREIQNGVAIDTPAPRRVDCHYLITAWSPARVTAAIEPTLDEHALLYEVTATLMDHESLVPREVYAPDPLPAGFPELIADSELPATLLPVEGFPKYAEFWGTMGNIHPWKPAVYLVVTIPVALQKEIAGPLVTTRITEYRQSGKPESAEVWIQIGGTVLDASDVTKPPRPVARAWVRLETETGNPAIEGQARKTTETSELGRFTFGELVPGRYRLRVRAPALGEKVRSNLDVPSPSGEYDVAFP